jgi:hypothetical protein
MAASSVSVVANALLLKRWRPPKPTARVVGPAAPARRETPTLATAPVPADYPMKEEIR